MSDDPQRVLLAGGTDELGRRTVAALLAAGHDVHVLDDSGAAASVRAVRPTVVVLLLSTGERLEIELLRELVAAAEEAHAQRIVVQSVPVDQATDEQAAAVARLEETTLDAGQAVAVVLRLGPVHVDDAADAIVRAVSRGWGVYDIVADASGDANAKARKELGWAPKRSGRHTEEGS